MLYFLCGILNTIILVWATSTDPQQRWKRNKAILVFYFLVGILPELAYITTVIYITFIIYSIFNYFYQKRG